LTIAKISVEKINNGWWLTFHTRCNVIDIWFFGDGLPFFQYGARSLTIGGKWIDEGGRLLPYGMGRWRGGADTLAGDVAVRKG